MSNRDHLSKAKDYIAKGEGYYRKAAEEIVAAMEEDSALGYGRIGTQIGKGETWCRDLVQWHTNPRGRETPYGAGAANNERSDKAKVRKTLRDPVQRREVIESLSPDLRTEIARDIASSTNPLVEREKPQREDEREVFQSIEDAPKHDLSAQAAKLIASASQIDVLLAEGAEFRRMNAKDLQRLNRDLDGVKDTADRLKEQITAQSRVRRIA